MALCHFCLTPTPLMMSFMYNTTAKMFDIKSNQGKRMTDLGPLLHYLNELPFLILIPSVFWQWIQAKLGPF